MKKTMKFMLVSAFVLVAGYNIYISQQNVEAYKMVTSDMEALADCEIFDSNHTLIVSCKGDNGVCYEVSDYLYCSGKKVKG